MTQLRSGPVAVLVGLPSAGADILLLLDIKSVFGTGIEGPLEEANDADSHVAHERYPRENGILKSLDSRTPKSRPLFSGG